MAVQVLFQPHPSSWKRPFGRLPAALTGSGESPVCAVELDFGHVDPGRFVPPSPPGGRAHRSPSLLEPRPPITCVPSFADARSPERALLSTLSVCPVTVPPGAPRRATIPPYGSSWPPRVAPYTRAGCLLPERAGWVMTACCRSCLGCHPKRLCCPVPHDDLTFGRRLRPWAQPTASLTRQHLAGRREKAPQKDQK